MPLPRLPIFVVALFFLGLTGPASRAEDDIAMKKKTAELWAAEDFEGLEKIARDCRAREMSILDPFPPIVYFYATLRGPEIASDEDAASRIEKYGRWLKACPDSVTARVALADFHITDAWRARGGGWASEVPEEKWPIFKARLKRARDVLDGPGMETRADPSITGLRLILEMAGAYDDAPAPAPTFLALLLEENATARIERQYNRVAERSRDSAKWWPEYFPAFDSAARALLPRWGGEEGDCARLATEIARNYSGDKADGAYAMVANMVLETEGKDFFVSSGFDIPRYLRGLDVLAREGESSGRQFCAQRAAFVEAFAGDPETARKRIFATGPYTIPSAWISYGFVFPSWEKCGAIADLARGVSLERSGQLEEAEAYYSALAPGRPDYWTSPFALRNGIFPLWKPDYGTTAPDLPPEKATPNQLYELTFFHLCAGNLDETDTYAAAFDSKRGHNLTGKCALACTAALRGDKEKLADIKGRFLAMKTDRKNYLLAQAYVSGKLGWDETLKKMPDDPFFAQGCWIMAVFALGENRPEEARRILEGVHRKLPFQAAAAFPESILWGALHRKFPNLLPPAK